MTEYNYLKRNGTSYVIIENEEISLGCGDLSTSLENFVVHSGLSGKCDYLVFFDSRGATTKASEPHSTINLIRDYFDY